MNQQSFVIDFTSSDEECLFVDIPAAAATVQIRLTHEGIIVDVWPTGVSNDSAATLAVTFEEIQDVLEHEEVTTQPRFHVDGHTSDDPDAMLDHDGEVAPFFIFDVQEQRNVLMPFKTREKAEEIAILLNAEDI